MPNAETQTKPQPGSATDKMIPIRHSAFGIRHFAPAALLALCAVVIVVRPAAAQQRPLVTEDPEPIGAGRVLIEGGIDYGHDQRYPASGLEGNLWRVPTIGVSFGISSIAEFQIDGGFYNHLGITKRDPTAPL